MSSQKYTHIINAPSSKIWAALSDFSNIQMFHPNVQDVDQLSEADRGLGAARRCNFYGGGSAVETITAWDDERQFFSCTVTELAAPLLDVNSSMRVEEIDSHRMGPFFLRAALKLQFGRPTCLVEFNVDVEGDTVLFDVHIGVTRNRHINAALAVGRFAFDL